jgi:hypothetical protein
MTMRRGRDSGRNCDAATEEVRYCFAFILDLLSHHQGAPDQAPAGRAASALVAPGGAAVRAAGEGLSPALRRLIKLVAKAATRKKLRAAVAAHEKAAAAGDARP